MTLLDRMWARFDRPVTPTCDHPGCPSPATRHDWDGHQVCDVHVTVVRYQRGRPPRPLP